MVLLLDKSIFIRFTSDYMCLGKGWDEMVGRDQTPDLFQIHNISDSKSSSPTAQMVKTYNPIHPFLSFRLKFDSDPARISLYLHLTRPSIQHTGIKEARNIWDASIVDREPGDRDNENCILVQFGVTQNSIRRV